MKPIATMAEIQHPIISCKPIRVRFEMDPKRIYRPGACTAACIM